MKTFTLLGLLFFFSNHLLLAQNMPENSKTFENVTYKISEAGDSIAMPSSSKFEPNPSIQMICKTKILGGKQPGDCSIKCTSRRLALDEANTR